jgi:CheY-like chemotaxis protein
MATKQDLLETRSQADLKPFVRPQARKRVLIIEDSDEAREIMTLLLTEMGQEVHVASRGDDGLATLLELRPDIALIDVGLPGIDGYEIARRARASPGGANLYLVALTGFTGPQAKAKATAAGFDRHLAKPLNFDELMRVLDRKD